MLLQKGESRSNEHLYYSLFGSDVLFSVLLFCGKEDSASFEYHGTGPNRGYLVLGVFFLGLPQFAVRSQCIQLALETFFVFGADLLNNRQLFCDIQEQAKHSQHS
jgi:hypothetical protein